VSVGDLFAGAILPSLLLTGLYALYVVWRAIVAPETCPPLAMTREERAGLMSRVFSAMIPPVTLIVAVLGSIIAGVATPTESASVGATGALFLAAVKVLADGRFAPEGHPDRDRRLLAFWLGFLAAIAAVATLFGGAGLLNYMLVVLGLALVAILVQPRLLGAYAQIVFRSCVTTMSITSMVFVILLGATAFALVFTQMGGGAMVRNFLEGMPGGQTGALITVFVIIFILGFFLDTFEILFIVVPITAPVLLLMGVDPIWLGVMMGVLLQTSFLTPPFGFSLFYLRGVAPAAIRTGQIYRGAVPFIGLQIVALAVLWAFPEIATWLPNELFRSSAPGATGAPPPPAFDAGPADEDEFL
jgi:TRAP-type mannitol/chloroaromatic compound transport system permease large subunit